jgi:hypothetical protein
MNRCWIPAAPFRYISHRLWATVNRPHQYVTVHQFQLTSDRTDWELLVDYVDVIALQLLDILPSTLRSRDASDARSVSETASPLELGGDSDACASRVG